MTKQMQAAAPPPPQAIEAFKSADDFKKMIAANYMTQIGNLLGDKKTSFRFLSGMMAAVQRNADLLECTPTSLINSFMIMAELGLMPSGFGGEAYVLPYWNSKKDGNNWVKVREAQFQLGYQGMVTLFYRAGVRKVVGELIREKDHFEMVSGEIDHKSDPFKPRGKRIGAYVILTLGNGETMQKVMGAEEILEIAKKFSKSYASGKSPWNEDQDTQGWMWIKTVLRQIAKLVPKNDALMRAIGEDDKDSVVADAGKPSEAMMRLENAADGAKSLTMGALAAASKDNSPKGKEDDADIGHGEGVEEVPTIEVHDESEEIGASITI